MNPKIIALQKARAAAVDKMAKAFAAAEAENRQPTPEEHAAFTVAKAELESVKAQLAAAELVAREQTELAQLADTPAAQLTMDAATDPKKAAGITTHDRAEDKPWGATIQEKFSNLMLAVRGAHPQIGIYDPRLRKHVSAAPSGSNESVGSEGMFALGSELDAYVSKLMFESAQLASRCFPLQLPTGKNTCKLTMIDETSRVTGSRFGGVQVYWRAEADTVTAKKPKVKRIDFSLQSLLGIWYATDEELEDVALMGQIGPTAFAEEIAFAVDSAIMSGNGAGRPLGITVCAGRVAQAKDTGQVAATITDSNLRNMWARLAPGARRNAAWFCGQDTEAALCGVSMPIGTGGVPVYLPPGGLSGAQYGTLFGRPVIVTEHNAAIGTEGDIVLADLGWYALLSQQGKGVTSESSIHVRFIYEETAFRFAYRVNGLPLYSSAITPASSGATISPYVTLATRA